MTMPTAHEQTDGLIHQQIEAAAKTLAEVMDYPWEHMPEQGRANMRRNAMRILEAALTQTGGWVSVDERLPEPDEPVLCFNGRWIGVGAWMSGECLEDIERWQDEHREFIEMSGPAVSHWMPLPPSPAAGEPA